MAQRVAVTASISAKISQTLGKGERPGGATTDESSSRAQYLFFFSIVQNVICFLMPKDSLVHNVKTQFGKLELQPGQFNSHFSVLSGIAAGIR